MRKYENVSIKKLIPYKYNARTHSEKQINMIADSIREYGFINPVLIDQDYNIIAGHGRILGAKVLGMTEVPCLFVEDLTETQKRAYIIADNKLSLEAGWDIEILTKELSELDNLNFDLELTGFSLDELKELEIKNIDIDTVEEDDYDVDEALEKIEEPKAKLGDLYKLGNHYLICGDSTDQKVIDKLLREGVPSGECLTRCRPSLYRSSV